MSRTIMNFENLEERVKEFDAEALSYEKTISLKQKEIDELRSKRNIIMNKRSEYMRCQVEQQMRMKEEDQRIREKSLSEKGPVKERIECRHAQLKFLELSDLTEEFTKMTLEELEEEYTVEDFEITNINQLKGEYMCGDVVSTSDYRWYSHRFVGPNGELMNTKRTWALDQEYGVTIPIEVTSNIIARDYTTIFTKEFLEEAYIEVIELPHWDKSMENYILPPNKDEYCYELRRDEDRDWEMYIIPLKDPSGEYSATKKTKK